MEAIRKRAIVGKLVPNWEGPFRVTKVIRLEIYRIEDLQENPKPHA